MDVARFKTAFYLLTAGGAIGLFLDNLLGVINLGFGAGLYMLLVLAANIVIAGLYAAGIVQKIVDLFK